jgi:hypothetical protein
MCSNLIHLAAIFQARLAKESMNIQSETCEDHACPYQMQMPCQEGKNTISKIVRKRFMITNI